MSKRAALYVRVSTDKQTVENQVHALHQVAERRGWQVVEQYSDAGISGAKGRDARPGLDQMLKDAQRRKFDVVMAWAIDRLGRSLVDLLGTIETVAAQRREHRRDCPQVPCRPRYGAASQSGALIMAERTKVPATQVTYSAIGRLVTITFRDGTRVVPPLKDALRLGDQLVRVIRPIEAVAA